MFQDLEHSVWHRILQLPMTCQCKTNGPGSTSDECGRFLSNLVVARDMVILEAVLVACFLVSEKGMLL